MRLCTLLMLLCGCPAERLGVVVPKGGAEAIDPAEIKRDLWRITDPRFGGRNPGSSGAHRVAERIAERFRQLRLDPGFAEGYRRDLGPATGELVCGARPGSGDEAVLVVAIDPGIGTLSAVPMSGLISLAKAFDTPTAPMHTIVFCVVPEAGGFSGFAKTSPIPLGDVVEFFAIGTLTGTSLKMDTGPTVGPLRSTLLHTGPLASDVSDDLGTLDFDGIALQLRAAYSRVAAVD